MKRLVLAIVMISGALGFAQGRDAMAGTWNLNVAKSRFGSDAPPKSRTTIFESIPNGFNAVSTTVRADGSTARIDTTFFFDGKEYDVHGPQIKTTRAYTRPSERRLEWTEREGGTVTTKTTSELSADGNIRTVTTTGRDPQGRAVNTLQVYDRVR